MAQGVTSIGPYRAVIFDMDGVIVDSEPRHERAFHEVVKDIGFEGKHSLRFAEYVGRTDRVLWEDFVQAHRPPQSLDALLDMKRRKVLEIFRTEQPLFEGLPELVESLAARIPLALASGSERPIVEEVLSWGDLRRFFKVTLSGSDITKGKPEPDIFLKTAALLGIDPPDCVVIEDSRPGVAAARAAGMRVIAITNTHPAGELGEATLVVSDYGQLCQVLAGREDADLGRPFPLK
jgi:HAD superfamily hydrolase (TIGR01509 family)